LLTQPNTQQIQWQDLKVISEVDLVHNIAQQNGWKDCEIFGYGLMITQPMESMGWNLIPADLFEYSIPDEGIDRILQIINAGVRIQGVIIADDLRRINPPRMPTKSMVSLPSPRTVFPIIGKALCGFLVVTIVVGLFIYSPWTILGAALLLGATMSHDPKLIVLVDDGNGGTTWISVLTWYD
jgi:hypothetical protein